MARPKDPKSSQAGVTDLRRYRRERERAQRTQARPAAPKAEGLLGGRRHAGLILVIAIVVLAGLALMGHGF